MGTIVRALTCSVVIWCLFTTGAPAQNFYELSQKKNCESVMESLRAECIDLNNKKDSICKGDSVPAAEGYCDIKTHINQIAEYKTDVARLAAGEIADADREALKARIEKTKAELDARKSDAGGNERAARACVDAREAVYEFFDKKVIPETQRAAADLKTQRDKLLEELDNAEVLQASAKTKLDELAGADPQKDRTRWEEYVKMQGENETNAAAFRVVQRKLADFNTMYGQRAAYIEQDVKPLIDYYIEKQKGHRIAIEGQKDRAQNCGKVEYMSY